MNLKFTHLISCRFLRRLPHSAVQCISVGLKTGIGAGCTQDWTPQGSSSCLTGVAIDNSPHIESRSLEDASVHCSKEVPRSWGGHLMSGNCEATWGRQGPCSPFSPPGNGPCPGWTPRTPGGTEKFRGNMFHRLSSVPYQCTKDRGQNNNGEWCPHGGCSRSGRSRNEGQEQEGEARGGCHLHRRPGTRHSYSWLGTWHMRFNQILLSSLIQTF